MAVVLNDILWQNRRGKSRLEEDGSPKRPSQACDLGRSPGGDQRHASPLQTRANFLQNWDWQFVADLNRGTCERGKAQYGFNPENVETCRQGWEDFRNRESTFEETLDFLRHCHRQAPFLFYNGNTFGGLARTLADFQMPDFPVIRRRELRSLVGHYVAGVLDKKDLQNAFGSLTRIDSIQVGDVVETLRGTTTGLVTRILRDGRIEWRSQQGDIFLGTRQASAKRIHNKLSGETLPRQDGCLS